MSHRSTVGRIGLVVILAVVCVGATSCSSEGDSQAEVDQFCSAVAEAQQTAPGAARDAAIAKIVPPSSIEDEWKAANAGNGSSEDGRAVTTYIDRHCDQDVGGGAAAVAACITEKQTLETAMEAFNAQLSRYPTSITELLEPVVSPDDDFEVKPTLKRAPTYWDVAPAADGSVRAKPGVTLPSGCG